MTQYLCAIRIRGMTGVRDFIRENLSRLRLRRKYSCIVLVNPAKSHIGMIHAVRNDVAYGELKKEEFEKLIQTRGQLIDKKKKLQNTKEIIEGLEKGKKYQDFNLKPFFRLHPPRKGIKSRLHVEEGGVLGNHRAEINKLLERML